MTVLKQGLPSTFSSTVVPPASMTKATNATNATATNATAKTAKASETSASKDHFVRDEKTVSAKDKGGGQVLPPLKNAEATAEVALVTGAELKATIDVSERLAHTAPTPKIKRIFEDAAQAAARLQKKTAVEIPMRLAVTTGKVNPYAQDRQGPRLPQEVAGVLKSRGDQLVFYPADESLRPFAVDKDLAGHLPTNTVLIARSTKKKAEFTLPDGNVEQAAVYALSGKTVAEPRTTFVGVTDYIGGEPFVRDLMPPVRLAALPTTTPEGKPWLEGAIVDVTMHGDDAVIGKTLANPGTPKARTWMVAAESRLDAVFPESCVKEAAAIEASAAASLADPSLVDLTKKPFFAIDNPGSTDIDQCMLLEKRPDGGYLISYALADPAHYIKPGSALFNEAMQRGASYYLPGLSISMLPDVLSEGVISLNAHEDHRAMVIKIHLDKDGTVEKNEVQRAKIHSQAQLTYAGVSEMLEGAGDIKHDEHKKAVPEAVLDQLALFQEIGAKRIVKAKERGVVEPDRREMHIGFDEGQFFLKDPKSDLASKLNAEFSILANVGGAEQLLSSTIPDLFLPALFRTHKEPPPAAYKALARQTKQLQQQSQLPAEWAWRQSSESLSAYVDRLKTLPTTPREKELSQVLQQAAVRINVASEYSREPGVHSGLKVKAYGRFSAPMREQVGVVSHAVLFAKDALERAVAGGLDVVDAKALWAPLLLGATVPNKDIPDQRRALAAETQALLTAAPEELVAMAKQFAALAMAENPNGLTVDETKAVDRVFDRARAAGNAGKMKQGQAEGAAKKLLFDDLFLKDLGGNPMGSATAPRREGVITSLTPSKVYIQLKDPDVELRLGMDDLRRNLPDARFFLDNDGCSLVTKADGGGVLAELVLGAPITVQATHHDGDRLHFGIVE